MKKTFVILLILLFLNGCNNNTTLKLDRTDTLTGIDENNNGIRDDVEQFILNTYKDISQQKAAMQYVKSIELMLKSNKSDPQEVKKAILRKTKASKCLFDRFANSQFHEYEVADKLMGLELNTKKRTLEYFKFNKALSGSTWAWPKGDTCEDK